MPHTRQEDPGGLRVGPWTAGILAVVAGSLILGALFAAWNTNAQQAVMAEKVTRLESTAVPTERIVKIEGQVQSSLDATARIEQRQQHTDDKIDKMADKLDAFLQSQEKHR